MTPRAAKLLNMASSLSEPLRLEVTTAISEADRLRELGDASAWQWLPEQLAYVARRYRAGSLDCYTLHRLYRAVQEAI